jgi:hypothetical protein
VILFNIIFLLLCAVCQWIVDHALDFENIGNWPWIVQRLYYKDGRFYKLSHVLSHHALVGCAWVLLHALAHRWVNLSIWKLKKVLKLKWIQMLISIKNGWI